MGMPGINITFQTVGVSAVKRSQKGIVAVILQDSGLSGEAVMATAADIPAQLGVENKAYLERAFWGYQNPPRKVIAYCVDGTEKTLESALQWFATQSFDYLAGPPDLGEEDAQKISTWVKAERLNGHAVKAVLPNLAADHEGIVNFTTGDIQAGGKTYTAAQYCSRIAGLIAGTPMTISCTYAPIPETADVERLTKAERDAAVDKGEFLVWHDGEKVKTGRAVNSLVTTTADKGSAYQKIKIVEAMDMMRGDIRLTAEDNYIGKYTNSYDNKLLLVTAIKGYFEELERAGILQAGTSEVGVDVEAQAAYLKAHGTDTSVMSEREIKEANTGSAVFLTASVKILDAIEDIRLTIAI